MREAIGGTWILQLVIVFMLLFVAFLALSLNYSKAFQIKNEMLTMIEKKEGVTSDTLTLMNNYLKNSGYRVQKNCPMGSYGVSDLNRNTISLATNGGQYYYCITKVAAPSTLHRKKVYYKIENFFYFNLPIIGDIVKFTINGTTNDIAIPADNLKAISE